MGFCEIIWFLVFFLIAELVLKVFFFLYVIVRMKYVLSTLDSPMATLKGKKLQRKNEDSGSKNKVRLIICATLNFMTDLC